jgi:hypothetical protein
MSKVCQCKSGRYSSKCCKDRLAQGIGDLNGQSQSTVDNQNSVRQLTEVVNATDL